MKARLFFRHKHIYADGAIAEIRAWVVSRDKRTPEGYKYSLVYVDSKGKRLLGYDNAEGKGHHRHEGNREESVKFDSVEELVKRFLVEVQEMRRKSHES
ncbi:MAG: hypothetical protein HY401_09015 [Elusimicrobia bacterium]|nr:hypothetical protein [Elusimicrobiota bacterium]